MVAMNSRHIGIIRTSVVPSKEMLRTCAHTLYHTFWEHCSEHVEFLLLCGLVQKGWRHFSRVTKIGGAGTELGGLGPWGLGVGDDTTTWAVGTAESYSAGKLGRSDLGPPTEVGLRGPILESIGVESSGTSVEAEEATF